MIHRPSASVFPIMVLEMPHIIPAEKYWGWGPAICFNSLDDSAANSSLRNTTLEEALEEKDKMIKYGIYTRGGQCGQLKAR